MKLLVHFTSAALALLVVAACSPDGAPRRGPVTGENPQNPAEAFRPAKRDPIQFTGTVHKIDMEGGVWVIRLADDTQYRPDDLPPEFQVEGLAVEVEALRHDDVLTKDMAGQAIELVEIRRQAAAPP